MFKGFNDFNELNIEINKEMPLYCPLNSENDNIPNRWLQLNISKQCANELSEIINLNINSNEKGILLLVCFLSGLNDTSVVNDYTKTKVNDNNILMLVPNFQFSTVHLATYNKIVQDFVSTIKAFKISPKSNIYVSYKSLKIKNQIPLICYFLMKTIFDNFFLKILKHPIFSKISVYEIQPKKIIQICNYFDTRINYTADFLTTYFGEKFYKNLLKNRKNIEAKYGISTSNFYESINEGFKDFKIIQKRTEKTVLTKLSKHNNNFFFDFGKKNFFE